mgnify:CR=1 FL=1
MYDSAYFDRIINRKNTSSLKYDFGIERKGRDDQIPLWVADMDFPVPDEVLGALKERVKHGIFGYTDPKADYIDSIRNWFFYKHNWDIRPESIIVTPGVVYAISIAINAYTKTGDSILIQQPVYYPFRQCVIENHRKLINSPLIYEGGRYRMDYDDIEKRIKEDHVKMILLCNPHNPVGRVWKKEELETLGDIALKYGVVVFSDEIHCDIVYPGIKHIPFATVKQEFENIVVVGTSPSKTFNMAGLQISNIVIPDENLRQKFRRQNSAAGYSQGNVLGMTACKAAYDKGDEWYRGMLSYLKENLDHIRNTINEKLDGIKLVEPEGTYLVWLDCSGLMLSADELSNLINDKAKLWLDEGKIFGEESTLFERMNIACPRSILVKALKQLEHALKENSR